MARTQDVIDSNRGWGCARSCTTTSQISGKRGVETNWIENVVVDTVVIDSKAPTNHDFVIEELGIPGETDSRSEIIEIAVIKLLACHYLSINDPVRTEHIVADQVVCIRKR